MVSIALSDIQFDQFSSLTSLSTFTLRLKSISIDKRFKDVIKRAGHHPWPAICNNIRATRANQVEREFGTVAELNWIGHAPGTFRKHYSQVHVVDMKKACAIDTNMTHQWWATELHGVTGGIRKG